MGYGVGLVARAPPSAQLLIRSAAMPLEERRVTAWLLATRVRGEKRPIPILRTAFPEELVQCTSAIVLGRKREGYISPTHNIIPFFLFIRCLLHCSAFLSPDFSFLPLFLRSPRSSPLLSLFFSTFFVCLFVKNKHASTDRIFRSPFSLFLSRSIEKNSFLAPGKFYSTI